MKGLLWPYAQLLFIAVLILWNDWKSLKERRSKAAYSVLYAAAFAVSSLMVYDRNIPGPIQLLNKLFAPIYKLLFQ